MTSEELAKRLEENINGQRKGGFYCKKHRITMFSMDYCPICCSECVYGKEEGEQKQ